MQLQVTPPAHGLSHQDRLDRLSQIAVHVGLGLRPGQEVVMTAPVEALPLVRLITEKAYQAGASLVTTLYADEAATLLRFRHAPPESFDKATDWLFEGNGSRVPERRRAAGHHRRGSGAPRPRRSGEGCSGKPGALKGLQAGLQLITGFDINWTILSYATPAWAKAMFPEESEGAATARLWDAIFRRLPGGRARPGRRLEGAQRTAAAACRLPEPETISVHPLSRARYGPDRRPG
jgi:aminopeptidase